MRLSLVIPVLSLLLLGSCVNTVVLHPIERQDIIRVPVGTVINGEPTDRLGYFLSDEYITEVAKARVEK